MAVSGYPSRSVAAREPAPSASFELGARALDDVRPFGGIRPDRFREVLRRAAARLVADLFELLRERFRLEHLVDRGIELVDDRPRDAGRRDHAGPGRRCVTCLLYTSDAADEEDSVDL